MVDKTGANTPIYSGQIEVNFNYTSMKGKVNIMGAYSYFKIGDVVNNWTIIWYFSG